MAQTILLPVKQLKIDLHNYRTVPQQDEAGSLRAMISITPDRFWALTESLLDRGYLSTENVLVLATRTPASKVVKEGNRRIAALKLIFGFFPAGSVSVPSYIQKKITALSPKWKAANKKVPCVVYPSNQAKLVDELVTLVHGKGDQAARFEWTSVATARHNRDINKIREPALEVLEKYLEHGQNRTPQQRERWSGDYPLTVLEDLLKRHRGRFGCKSPDEFADKYPQVPHQSEFEDVLLDIGLKQFRFEELRGSDDLLEAKYKIPVPPTTSSTNGSTTQTSSGPTGTGATTGTTGAITGTTGATTTVGNKVGSQGKGAKSTATNDPRSVKKALQSFNPRGPNRQKVVTLLEETRGLNLTKQPLSFCFLLRSMFEISAKAYCGDHAANGCPAATRANGEDRMLVEVLRDVTTYMTKGNKDKAVVKQLHGATAELAKQDGFLSVTSMNQLIHNPKFTVDDTHVSTLFGNIFPLLEAMN